MRKKYKDNYNPENIYQDGLYKHIKKKSLENFIKARKIENPLEDYVDIEKEYKKQAQRLEELELERFIYEKRVNGIYRTRTTIAGNQLEVDIYPSFQFATDVPKEKKNKGTSKSQKICNDNRSRRKFVNTVNTNFGEGDLWISLTYTDDNLPSDWKRAKRNVENYVKRIKRMRKKLGLGEFKYLYTTEYDVEENTKTGKAKTRIHHHFFCSGDMDRDLLEQMWKLGKRNDSQRLHPDKKTHLTGVALYSSKDPKGAKHWSGSQNLKKPTETKSYSKFKKRTVEKMIKQYDEIKEQMEKKYPGYEFIDAKVMFNKHNQGNYIYARMVRKDEAAVRKKQVLRN